MSRSGIDGLAGNEAIMKTLGKIYRSTLTVLSPSHLRVLRVQDPACLAYGSACESWIPVPVMDEERNYHPLENSK
jgi:hypothetical protein